MPEENKLFFGNLPQSFSNDDFTKLVSHFGATESVRLLQKEGAHNKYGFVAFKDKNNADESKKHLHDKSIAKHQIFVDFARSSNDLVVKHPKHVNRSSKSNSSNKKKPNANPKTKRKLPPNDEDSASSSPHDSSSKRRKLSTDAVANANANPYMGSSNKKIPQSRIVVLSGVPQSMSLQQLKERFATEISEGAIQYLIYPADDPSLSRHDNVAWILHQTVWCAQHTIDGMHSEETGNGFRASFARKLNKLYRVRVTADHNTIDTNALKQFINAHFDRHYQQRFDDEENRKFEKMLRYTKQQGGTTQAQQPPRNHNPNKRKKSNKKHDVIQQVKRNAKSSSITVEFKKVDYALFAVQHMNGVQFESSKTLRFRFELESETAKSANADRGTGNVVHTTQLAPAPSSSSSEATVVLKMFHIAKSVQLEQLRAFIASVIAKLNGGADSMTRDDAGILQEIIYPAPDSLPDSQTAWICIAAAGDDDDGDDDDDTRSLATQLIRELRDTEINGEAVGITMADASYVKPQTIMVRNLPNTATQTDLRRLLERFGSIAQMSMKSKLDSTTQHSRWCFVTFHSVRAAAKAIQSMNGYALKGKLIACDYTLPKDMYSTIQKKWKQQQQTPPKRQSTAAAAAADGGGGGAGSGGGETTNGDDTTKPVAKLTSYKQYEFMQDYEEKSFFLNFYGKDKSKKKPDKTQKKVKALHENVEIPVSSEPAHYDWLRCFLRKNRLQIMQYDTNCKLYVSLTAQTNHVQITSDNVADSQKAVAVVNDMMQDKEIRELGYTQVMNIPFDCEHQDFDWILYLNGDAYRNRIQFESHTGCSFMLTGKLSSLLLGNKSDLLQLKLVAPTHKALQRGARCMKEQFLRADIKHERQSQMEHKLIKRVYFPPRQSSSASSEPSEQIDYISLIISPNGQRLKQIEQQTNCKLRVFGSNFENKKNIKSYCKIMAKTQSELDKAVGIVNDLLHNEETRSKAIAENFRILNDKKKKNGDESTEFGEKKFWFYSGDANEGRTVFVRNLPFDATEESILQKFDEFGRIISVKLVFDKTTGNPRGSCFVQFDNTQSVNAVMDGSTSLTINGRRLIVNVAINKGAAKRIETDKQTKDKRNLYLAKEGVIMDEQQMSELTPIELNRRIEAWKEKQEKLQNPNFHVSKTRLSIRNIPGFVRPNRLKQLFHDSAVRLRHKLKDETSDDGVFEFPHPKIMQSKIVRKSRFGFIEFREHSDALLVLRELNNAHNAEIFHQKIVSAAVMEKEENDGDEPGVNGVDEDEGEDEGEEGTHEDVDEGEDVDMEVNQKKKDRMGRMQIEFAVQNMKKIHIHNEKVRVGQMKWRQVSMEKLKDKMKILKAQKQDKELKVVQGKMTKLHAAIKKDVAPNKKITSKKVPKKMNKWTTTIKRF